MNIDFFEPIEAKTTPSIEIDWYNFDFILKEYNKNKHFLLKIPENLSNDISYFRTLGISIPMEQIYPYFSHTIQTDNDILKNVLSYFINSEQLHLLPKEIRKDCFWMLIILKEKPFLYHYLEPSLLNNIDFHCRLLKTLLDKTILAFIDVNILHSYEFLNTCSILLEENKIDIVWLKKYLPFKWQMEMLLNPLQYKEIFFSFFLKLKLELDMDNKKLIEKKIKI